MAYTSLRILWLMIVTALVTGGAGLLLAPLNVSPWLLLSLQAALATGLFAALHAMGPCRKGRGRGSPEREMSEVTPQASSPLFDAENTTSQSYFWKFAMNSVTDFFYAKDLQGRYLGQNKSLLDLFGHKSEQDVIGKSNYDLYSGILDKEMLDILEEADLRASYSDVPILSEEMVPKENGEMMICESIKCSYRSPEGEIWGMISVSRDITLRRRAEEEQRTAIQAASKAKDAFLANTSHEVRTPLNGILGMLYLTLQTDLNEQQRSYLEKGEAAARHLLAVVNDILDFSKMEAGKMELDCAPFALEEAVTQVVDLHRTALASDAVKIELEFDPSIPPWLFGDNIRVCQVITNLLGNAVKFTAKGWVRLTCSLVERKQDSVLLCVSVEDTGIGMTEAQVRRLFTAFDQADASTTRKFGGTGLGLAISRQLVHLMGGTIEARSAEGKGSAFSFTLDLPLCDTAQQAENMRPAQEDTLQRDLEGCRILLAEDNAINRIIACEILQQLGAVVDEAHDGLEAVEKVQKNEYDIVLMDIQMPQMDGLTATRILRKNPRFQNLPIIAMTAHAMSKDYQESLDAGMQEHVTKPIDPQLLCAAIQRWVP